MTKKVLPPTLLFLTLLFFSFLFSSFSDGRKGTNRDNTPGTVTFTVTTLPAGGNYSPKHVLAIWVEKDGDFVKTRKAMANQRKQYLYTWRASSNYNVIDAITGPTLTSHQTHTIEWDCTDLDGNVVPDGDYTMLIEFTDKHAQGPLYSIDFAKGTEPVSISPPNQTYFINMQLTYEPDVVAVAEFSADVTETCIGQNVVFTDNSTGATSWEWNFGDGANPSTANTQGPHTVTYSTPGPKTVSLTINGSVSITKTNYINVHPNPESGFTYEIVSRTVTFTNTSQHAISYLWDFGDGNTSMETNPVHVYAEDGEYEVILVAVSQFCGSDAYLENIVINTVGIDENSSRILEVFPNPSNGSFNFAINETLQNMKIRLFDVRGKMVFSHEKQDVVAGFVFSAEHLKLEPGMYFLNFSGDNILINRKLLVVK